MRVAVFWSLFLMIVPQFAEAFPELSKHGYANCMACHVSPSGGGVLTEYGRALSKEALSTWGRKREERFMYRFPTTQQVALGGDFRWLHLQDNNPRTGKRTMDIVMQRDLEAAVTVQKFTVDATIGLEEDRRTRKDEFISRRHYGIFQANENITIRGGRFYPQFGLYIPEHTSVIRRGLGWDQSQETYNLEGAWQNDSWNFFGTAIFGRPDEKEIKREKGGAVSVAWNPVPEKKFGYSHYYGETEEITHHYTGPWAIVGLGRRFFILAQLTAVRTFPYTATEAHWGLVDYFRFDYEFYKGFHAYFSQEFSQTNFKSNATRGDIFSAALQVFPRPHLEFQLIFQQIYTQGLSSDPTNRIMFLAHFYP